MTLRGVTLTKVRHLCSCLGGIKTSRHQCSLQHSTGRSTERSTQSSPQASDAEDCLLSKLQVPEANHAGVLDLPQLAERHINLSIRPEVPCSLRKRRKYFTGLQEEALVYRVAIYGRGKWKKISDEGWFDGRRTSDKYRNLEKNNYIADVTSRVMKMLEAGRNLLKELRALYEQQHLQRATSPVEEQRPQRRRLLSGGTTVSQRASSVLGSFNGSSTTMSSDLRLKRIHLCFDSGGGRMCRHFRVFAMTHCKGPKMPPNPSATGWKEQPIPLRALPKGPRPLQSWPSVFSLPSRWR
ncbi:hypothetical protein HPB50_007756 [Hyalomma asiaticum]|uniref:Uncharacterized protein n=1 Tax=Hyalomma asiaticum TaxID=266040 RepID=A0ACB7TKC2_HYAAI|nr:hypothetical protein HPB50_007756 [Hyalomma asiaticum]